jgi:hypothetical protein
MVPPSDPHALSPAELKALARALLGKVAELERTVAAQPEEIVAKLHQAKVLVAQGKLAAEAVRAIGVTEPTYYRWRAGLEPAL